MKELIFFHKGIDQGARSALQDAGSLRKAENIDFAVDGDQQARMSFSACNATPTGNITSLRRFEQKAIVTEGANMHVLSPLTGGTLTAAYAAFQTGERWRFREFKKFLHGVNGYNEVLFDENGLVFAADISNPVPPSATHANSGGAVENEKYMCYVSYYITFPNGMIYETGLSDGFEVDCSSGSDVSTINWTVPVSAYSSYNTAGALAFNKTLALLHFNGPQGGSTFTDSTGKRTWTASGGAIIDNSWDTLGTNAVDLDGTDAFIYTADAADLILGAAAFTAHFWLKLDALPTAGNSIGLFGQADASNRFNGYLTNNTGVYELHLYATAGATVHHLHGVWTTPVVGTEYHLAFIRGWGGETATEAGWKITVEGTALTSVFDTSNPNLTIANIGGNFEVGRCRTDASTVLGYVDGKIKEFVLMTVARWTANFTVPDEQSFDASIRRKLYRGPGTGGTLSDIFYVATLYDNSTTSYADTASAATLAANGPCFVEDYGPGPHSDLIEYHYGRLFLVERDRPWRLWYSEPAQGETAYENEYLMPIAFLSDNYDDIRVSGFEKSEIMALLAWGTNFFIALKQTWIRRQGNDPETWSYKKTWAKHGVCSKDSVGLHKHGILYLTTNEARLCGIAIFNGQTSDIITSPKFDYLFNKDMDANHASTARGTVAGNYYFLIYRNIAGHNRLAVFDLRRFPDLRLSYWGIIGAGATELMPNQVDRDFSGASAWANVDFSSYNETGDLSVTATAAGQYCTLQVASAPTTVGQRYTLELDSSSMVSTMTVKSYDGTQTIANVLADGTDQKFTFTAETTGGYRIVADAATSSANFDNFSLKADGISVIDCYSQGYDEANSLSLLVGCSNGVVYYDNPGSAVPFEIESKDCIGSPQVANDEKTLKELRYNLDTGGASVWLEIWIDGVRGTWSDGETKRAISGTGDKVQAMRDMPPGFKGRMFRFKIFDTAGHTTMHIYSPWSAVFDVTE